MTFEQLNEKIYKNTLNTCHYVSGYQNRSSEVLLHCDIHNITFTTKYENVGRDNRPHHVCPKCKELDKQDTNSNIELICAYCGKKFQRQISRLENSKSGFYFCCREHKDLAQSLKGGDKFKSIRPNHYGQQKTDYRKTAFDLYPHKCHICGWAEDEDVLEVHHIDENHKNNDENNLIILCPICHRKITSHKYKLINRSYLQKIDT